MKKALPIHPFLFAIFPILFLFAHNIGQIFSISDILPSLIIALSSTLLLLLLLRMILKDSQKSAIIVSIFLVLFFLYGHIFNIIRGWQIGVFVIGRNRYLMAVWAVLFSYSAYLIIRTPKQLLNFTKILNSVALSIVVIPLINIGFYELKAISASEDNSRSVQDREVTAIDSESAAALRDIYYIILDGYANTDTLKELFDYDNHEFIDYLTKKNFYIAYESRINYSCTFLSLASSLNMEYLNYLKDEVGEESKDATKLVQMIRENKLMRFLKLQGYSIIVISGFPMWGSTNRNSCIDSIIYCDGRFASINEFTELLIQTTMLDPFLRRYIRANYREKTLCTLAAFAKLQKIERPKFVFAHIPCPHPPYVFGRDGEPTQTKSTITNWKPEWQYLDQLIFLNKQVKVLIERILSEAETLPIIILQADHGPAFSGNQPIERVFKERMPIFNAYYFPDNGKRVLYKSVTPVNTFRLIFNYYFNADYPLLEDKVYFTNTDKSFYKFIDITDQVKKYD